MGCVDGLIVSYFKFFTFSFKWIITTPFFPLSPYISVADLSFRTVMFCMSSVAIFFICSLVISTSTCICRISGQRMSLVGCETTFDVSQ